MVASESSLGAVLALLQRLEESDSGDQELERTATEMRNILPRVLASHLAAFSDGDVESCKTLLQCVKMLSETWPVVYEHGEVVGVAPCLFVLFPVLAVPSLKATHESMMEALDALLLLLLTKDIWAARVLLDDCLVLLSDVASHVNSASDMAAKTPCFATFHELASQEDAGLEICTVDLSGRDQCVLIHTAMARIVMRFVGAAAHFFQDSFRSSRLWELLCAQLDGDSEFRETSATLLSTLFQQFPPPVMQEDSIGDTLIAAMRRRAQEDEQTSAAFDHSLALCFEMGFPALTTRCIRALAEELLPALFVLIAHPSATPVVRAALCRVLETTVQASPGQAPALLRLAPLLHDKDLRLPLVRLGRAALVLLRKSPTHAQAILDLFVHGDDFSDKYVDENKKEAPGLSDEGSVSLSISQRKRAREWWEAQGALPAKRQTGNAQGASYGPSGQSADAHRGFGAWERGSNGTCESAANLLAFQFVQFIGDVRAEGIHDIDRAVRLREELSSLQTFVLMLDSTVHEAVWRVLEGHVATLGNSMQILMEEHLLENFFVLVRTLSQAMPIAIDVTGLEHVVNRGLRLSG